MQCPPAHSQSSEEASAQDPDRTTETHRVAHEHDKVVWHAQEPFLHILRALHEGFARVAEPVPCNQGVDCRMLERPLAVESARLCIIE